MLLGLYGWLLTHGYPLPFARTVAFVSLVAGNVALIFVIRALPGAEGRANSPERNRYLLIVLCATGAALLLLMTVPPLAQLFGLVALLNN
jgi:Ca2+-transporting ATPase